MYLKEVLIKLVTKLSAAAAKLSAAAELSPELLPASIKNLRNIFNSINTLKTYTLEKMDQFRIKTLLQSKFYYITQFIGIHGSDFTLLQSLFPHKTRKQLKKKYQ